jgi:hypothetical protein
VGVARIVWKKGKSGGKWAERIAPHHRHGGTCEWQGQVLLYDDLLGSLKVQGGKVFHHRPLNAGFVNYCSLEEVAAIIDSNGRQIYPAAPADE